VKQRRFQELTVEKLELERRAGAAGTTGGAGDLREAMLEAHSAIAKAFGDAASQHPCARLIDEPTLKLTAALFRHPLLRRFFFGVSTVMWLFALRTAVAPDSGHVIHV